MDHVYHSPEECDTTPPKPRKLPQQSRSRMLVESVKEACLKILKESGPRGLTATQISEVSGVAMGSIYQYFPNVDAIIATIYEDLMLEEMTIARQKVSTDLKEIQLEDSLSFIIRGVLAFHRRMLRLDKEFHQRFYKTFDMNRWFNEHAKDPQGSTKAMQAILEAHKDELPLKNAAMEAFILDSAIHTVILDSVKYHCEYIDNPKFAQYLIHLVCGVLNIDTFTYKKS